MTFNEYYKYYLTLHQNRICRRLHVLGQLFTLSFLCIIIYFGGWAFLLLPITPFIVYPFAWSGHFFYEKNQPAAFKNPILAKCADWVMLLDIIRGKLPF